MENTSTEKLTVPEDLQVSRVHLPFPKFVTQYPCCASDPPGSLVRLDLDPHPNAKMAHKNVNSEECSVLREEASPVALTSFKEPQG